MNVQLKLRCMGLLQESRSHSRASATSTVTLGALAKSLKSSSSKSTEGKAT